MNPLLAPHHHLLIISPHLASRGQRRMGKGHGETGSQVVVSGLRTVAADKVGRFAAASCSAVEKGVGPGRRPSSCRPLALVLFWQHHTMLVWVLADVSFLDGRTTGSNGR